MLVLVQSLEYFWNIKDYLGGNIVLKNVIQNLNYKNAIWTKIEISIVLISALEDVHHFQKLQHSQVSEKKQKNKTKQTISVLNKGGDASLVVYK